MQMYIINNQAHSPPGAVTKTGCERAQDTYSPVEYTLQTLLRQSSCIFAKKGGCLAYTGVERPLKIQRKSAKMLSSA